MYFSYVSLLSDTWITTAVRRGINRKNKAGRKARKTKKPKDRERYRKLKAQARGTSRQAYNNYVHDIISPEQTENPKRFWSFIKSKKQDNSGIAPLRCPRQQHGTTSQQTISGL